MKENIVIGIEGLVGTGKTSICRNLLKYIPNSIVLHAGNIYRAITYQIIKENIPKEKINHIDLKELFENFEIEIKIENCETVVYAHNKKIDEDDLQSVENSLAVSKISGIANNEKAYLLVKKYIDNYKKKYNVIFSGRDTEKIYPNLDYHFFIVADLEKRVEWKYSQYDKKIDKEELRKHIAERDDLQNKSGFYKIYDNTITIDVTNCTSIEDSTKKVLEHIL